MILSQWLVVAACAVLVVLAIGAIGAMPRRGSWGMFGAWLAVGCSALAVAAGWRELPLPAALLLLALAVMLWGQRGRICWAAARGVWW